MTFELVEDRDYNSNEIYRVKDRNDYQLFLNESNQTEEMVRNLSENVTNLTHLPNGEYKFVTSISNIEGVGIFATGKILSNELLGPARIKNKRTILGRFINHSANPNTVPKRTEDGFDIVAKKPIYSGEEITINYRETMNLAIELDNQKLDLMNFFEQFRSLSKNDARLFLEKIEREMLKMPQSDLPIKHYFSTGVYGREMSQVKGTLVIGKIHKHSTMNVLSKGDISIFSEDGIMRLKAPCTFVSNPGAKRLIYAHEDTIFSNFHGTEETDIEKIEEQFIAKNYSEVVMLENNISNKIRG